MYECPEGFFFDHDTYATPRVTTVCGVIKVFSHYSEMLFNNDDQIYRRMVFLISQIGRDINALIVSFIFTACFILNNNFSEDFIAAPFLFLNLSFIPANSVVIFDDEESCKYHSKTESQKNHHRNRDRLHY